MKSQPITISRYSNGTLVRLNVTDSAFVSYDYNPETDAATYIPNTITITPTFSGGVKFGKWRYSTNGANFYDVVSGQHGFTTSGNTLILSATSDLYKSSNSAVIVACYGDNPLYYDTVTIMRYVDPTFVYKKTSTAIKQTNDKISLIAAEEQLAKYGSKFTVLDDLQAQIDVIPSKISLAVKEEHGIITGEMNTALAAYATLETMESRLDITAKDITSSVARTYQTKADAIEDLDEAKGYTDDVKATLRSEIQQSANSITSTVSATYQTIADAEDDLDEAKSYADNKDAALKTEIKQTTDSISSTVSEKVGKDEIISSINQSAESIKINANKVNITGFVTFDNLKNSGETTINGSNITTGSISASLIKGGKLILQPGNTYTTAMEVQDTFGNKLIAIDANGMTGYVGGVVPTFKLLENEISFYRYSTVLTQIKDGDIRTAGKMYFTSGSSYAGTHIIEIGQTSSGAVLNVISGKTTLKATEISASLGKALQITGNSSDYALHVTHGETVLQKLTAGETTINNTLTVKTGWNSSDAIKVLTGRINAPVYYGALYATSSNLGFFGGGTNATKQYVSKLYLNATLANVITKVNDLLTALARYNLITSY